jgi:hypothetical protein
MRQAFAPLQYQISPVKSTPTNPINGKPEILMLDFYRIPNGQGLDCYLNPRQKFSPVKPLSFKNTFHFNIGNTVTTGSHNFAAQTLTSYFKHKTEQAST